MKKAQSKSKLVILGFLTLILVVFGFITSQVITHRELSDEQTEASGTSSVSGELIKWYPLEISFTGPQTSETATDPNPFLGYRLQVEFTSPSDKKFNVPGFYSGDGNGAPEGGIWKVRFSPDEPGEWKYKASFRKGENIAVDLSTTAGTATHFDGETGKFDITDRKNDASGFLKWGILEYVNKHYLKFRDGNYFIKGGVNSPENFLGYAGFDNTIDTDGDFLHKYEPHKSSFVQGDPVFKSAETDISSEGIIGALNYLSSKNVNSIYFLPMNLGGDAKDTYPFISPTEKLRYDVSKLDQWNVVFEHAIRKGILLHFVLAETETDNANFLDNGNLGVERKLFYRELIARFGHNLAIKWNIQEETNYSSDKVVEFANYIKNNDVYNHPISTHTWYDNPNAQYAGLIGKDSISITSIQYGKDNAGKFTEEWRKKSADAGRPWVIDMDENAVDSKLTGDNIDQLRKEILYPIYFSGGNIEWYMEPDQALEDFRTREAMWNYMWYARKFMNEHLPFWEMSPTDSLHNGSNVQVFSKTGIYALYFPSVGETSNGNIDLTAATGKSMKGKWYNPRTGNFEGDSLSITGGAKYDIPKAPGTDDWVLLITDESYDPASMLPDEEGVPTELIDRVYNEKDGLLVVEFESKKEDVAGWEEGTTIPKYTGSGYLKWIDTDYFADPGNGEFKFEFNINDPGQYNFRIRNYHDDPDPSENNDVWVKLDGGNWIKTFSGDKDAWTWATNHEFSETNKVAAQYDLSKGKHTIYFSGRSQGFHMDRFHLYKANVTDPLNISKPESTLLLPVNTPTPKSTQSATSTVVDEDACIKNIQTICMAEDKVLLKWDSDPKAEKTYNIRLNHLPGVNDQCKNADGVDIDWVCSKINEKEGKIKCNPDMTCDDRFIVAKGNNYKIENLSGDYEWSIQEVGSDPDCRMNVGKIECEPETDTVKYCGSSDENGDGKINLSDFSGFKRVYHKECIEVPVEDICGPKDAIINGKSDGIINIKDFSIWINKYKKEICD